MKNDDKTSAVVQCGGTVFLSLCWLIQKELDGATRAEKLFKEVLELVASHDYKHTEARPTKTEKAEFQIPHHKSLQR